MKKQRPIPPRFATKVLLSFLRDDLQDEVVGDLKENFDYDLEAGSRFRAKLNYWKQVFLYLRPFAIRKLKGTPNFSTAMYRSYFRAAMQNMVKNKLHAVINILGLATGIAVAFIISLWIYDEVSYNRNFSHYDRIGRTFQNVTANGEVSTWPNVPWPLGNEVRQHYGADFQYVSMVSQVHQHTLEINAGTEKYSKTGLFCEPDFYTMFDVTLVKGTLPAKDPSTIMLSESTATGFFGDKDPIGQLITMDGHSFQVGAVYQDFPQRSQWAEVLFIGQWSKYAVMSELEKMDDPWRPNAFEMYVMLADGADFASASTRIKDARLKNLSAALAVKKPQLFLLPMRDWHLRSEFSDGKQAAGLVQYVWMFGIVGVFVLLMACINFMNLSTARSEKRAKEVGIRKAIGSYRSQLITQFFSESIFTVFMSLILALGMTYLLLPLFNSLAEKNMSLPWRHPLMWVGITGAGVVIGLLAGSYPALYLSSIRPAGALKGVFKAGTGASLPRKILVVVQFSVSAMMIIGTTAVFLQLRHGKNRPLGYSMDGLVMIPGISKGVHDHYDVIRKSLIDADAIVELTESIAPVTGSWGSSSRIDWSGKDPDLSIDFTIFEGSYEYGKTIQWEVIHGRDFSRDFPSDSAAVILNEEAAKYLGKKDVIGETLRSRNIPFTVVGVVRDVVFAGPYNPVWPSLYFLSKDPLNILTLRLNPEKPVSESLAAIEATIKPHMNGDPFRYEFIDTDQARKFGNEERVSTLASIFAGLAIFISCLGIFGLSSFIAEQRTKEIGVRKVLGANLSQLWILLSKDFIVLITISCFLAVPIAYWMLQSWLEGYKYRVNLPWWIFVSATAGTLIITMLTVSWHVIKVARINPANTLKIE
ncbi:ABC transporter permease [Parachryseolinea silvisoli]|uniref:ABC transporter permease n=1 Tax=Parachryseolinea silvisoli TaxID=2873601 RepID=UPI00226592EE|nr:ABC transporter permease [Parachryseolinea silvisoli]MCD9020095.1 ABC transporter permease [Parachryseolinea silvisoli]